MNKLTNFVTIALTGFIITSCENNDLKGDTSPPGKLLIESVVSTSGGGVIFYNLPSDADVLFVRADYKNAQNDEVYRVSSKDNDSIEIIPLTYSEICNFSNLEKGLARTKSGKSAGLDGDVKAT